jgi:hypothetical protein
MKSLLLVIAAASIAAVTVAVFSRPSPAPASPAPALKRPNSVFYGHIKSMKRAGGRFELRFDPEWWLTGVTAQRVALEETGSSDVPNDYLTLEEGHRLLTFVVAANAQIGVLTAPGEHARVAPAELMQIVKGRNPRHRRLFERYAGYWLTVGDKYPNPAVSLVQQYQP